MSDYEDIMDLLGPSVVPFEPSSQEVSRPAPPTVRDTTSEANVWLPTSVAAHYREYDRFGPAVDELEALIARDGLLTPIRISTDGREAVVHEGNHRLQVAERLGISEVPAIVTFDSPVFSNGGRVTPLEPVLGSWVEQNRGSLRSFWGHRTASSDIVVRGFKYDEVSFELGQKYMNGTMTARDIIGDIEKTYGSVGIWWGTVGSSADDFYGSTEDAREYAGWSGDGSIEHRWQDMLDLTGGQVDPSGWIEAEIRVVLVAKKPVRDYGIWNPTTENGEGSMWESTSFFEHGERLELVEIQYAADRSGNNWKSEAVGGLTVTAHRTAANDLRVHLYDSEGNEMRLEPDLDSNPWTYHPKVMDAVRFLADAAQSNGVYWHMDHNEWIPSTITDFKVFDGANDVTHEIKEFPQLQGRYASRTASVDYILQKLLDECETSETSYHDYAILQSFMTFPEETLDTHPFAWELKRCQKEARESEYPETDNVLVEWLIEINEKGKAYQSRTAYVSDDIYESYYDTDRLVYLVMNVNVWGADQPLWELVANSYEEAQAFFDSLDEDERRVNVSEVLENGGWTMSAIGRKFSTRIAAEPGGVLPWNPSHRGYTWITKTDGTLEAVTNDGVNRMYLHEYPYGWEWEVFDSLGFVEGGTFGMGLKGGDALRQRANELLAEFDTRAEMRTRGPSRGYQDDYTPAPNTLWSKKATTSQRYAERLRREGRR